MRQIIDLRDADRSRYFAIIEFNNCFFLRSPSLFFNEYLREAKRSGIHFFTQERNIICNQTQLDEIADEQTIICRQLFAGPLVGFRLMKRKEKLHRVIIQVMKSCKRLPPLSLRPCRLCYLKFKRVSIIAIDLKCFIFEVFTKYVNHYLIVRRCLNNESFPKYLKDMLTLRQSIYSSRRTYILSLCKPATTTYGLNSFRYFAFEKWHSLPNNVRSEPLYLVLEHS